MDGVHQDLGGGVFDDGRPVETPPVRSDGKRPTCPRCGETDRPNVEIVDRPEGRFYCACGTLFNGGDREWWIWARERKESRRRLEESSVTELHQEETG